jgi:hypothetical protein
MAVLADGSAESLNPFVTGAVEPEPEEALAPPAIPQPCSRCCLG